MKSYFIFLSLCYLLASTDSRAAGELDPTFDAGSVLDNSAYAITIQPDGKLLIGGDFSTVPGLTRNRIARLNADGSGDPSFNPGAGAGGHVRSIALQPDGKILVGGWFTNFDGASHNRIVRLNGDGSLDSGFNVGSGANDAIFSVARQSDGKVLIGGYFTNVNGLSRSYIARLNADGSVDAGFNPAADSYVYAILIQPGGKILVGGLFTTLSGVRIHGIARLNEDGSLDTSFNPGSGVDYEGAHCLALQSDGRVLMGGYFGMVDGQRHRNIARLNANGSVDASFTGDSNDYVGSIAVQADSKVLISGQFYTVDDTNPKYLARLHPDGSLDKSFNPAFYSVSSIAVEPQGTILVSGGFAEVDGVGPRNLVRLNPDGSVNNTLNSNRGINGAVYSGFAQPDGRIVVAGYFSDVNNERRQGIARFQSDGRLDKSFDPGPILNVAYYSMSNPVVYCVALQSDGKIVVGGGFTNINGTGRNNIARLNPDGSVDASFNPLAGPDYSVYRVVLQPDGKVLILGGFLQVNGVARNYFGRLKSDGSLDADFNPDVGFVNDAAVQPDGKIVVAGDVTASNSVYYSIERLNSDGSLDPSFVRPGANQGVSCIALQLDGKILIKGSFTSINGIHRQGMARLNSDGSVDPSFDPQIDTSDVGFLFEKFLLQPDGKIVVSGTIDANFINGFVVRMNPDGSSDDNFARCDVLGLAVPIALQPDSKLIIGGSFSIVKGEARRGLARLLGDVPIIITQPASRTNIVATTATFTVSASGAPVLRYQWYRDGVALIDSAQIIGATSATLTLKHAQFRDAGAYTVTVSNNAGSTTSDAANLRVTTPVGRK
jgi:uncharacterized delta-60 repeat protein